MVWMEDSSEVLSIGWMSFFFPRTAAWVLYITYFTGSFFSPPLDPGRPVQLQLDCSLSSRL